MNKLLFTCVVAVLVLLLAALPLLRRPLQEAADDGQLVVGVVELPSESAWRDEAQRSLAGAAQEAGVQLLPLLADRTLLSQIETVRTLITYQVDAIVLSPVVTTGWDNVLREAKAAGVPLILTDRRIKTKVEGAVAAFVGTDYEAQGREAARFVKRAFAGSDRPVRIMELLGTVGASSTIEVSHGIRSVFARDEQYDIFYSVNCDMMRSKARETCGIFLSHGDLPDVLIAYSDAMVYGAIEAMEALGIRPGIDIQVVSFDAEQEAMDLLAAGKINCEIETCPRAGEAVMQAVLALRGGEAVNPRTLLSGAVFTKADAQAGLAARGY